MASIYKPAREKAKKRGVWFVDYTDHCGRRRTLKGFSDRTQTERLAAKLEHEVMLRKRGLIDTEQEDLLLRKRKPLADHLKAFERSLSDNTPKHVKLTMGRVRRVIAGCKFETASQIAIESVEEFLRELSAKEDLGNRTYNHYVQAFDEFCIWMVKTRRIEANPLVGLGRLNTEVDVRRRRRALTPEELGKLVESARASKKKIQCFDGETRARLYLLSYMTGLRRNELASLTPRSFDLNSSPPTVTVEAAYSKHRRRDVLPLHPDLATMLPSWLVGMPPEAHLFPKLGKRRTWLMVKKDLEHVGIPYETADGVADFHAAGRHSHITELLRNGASLPEAKELARHSDVKMTMRYTHIGMADQARAIRRLPAVRLPVKDAGNGKSSEVPLPDGCQRSASASGVSTCQSRASGDTGASLPRNDASPVSDRAWRGFSSPDGESKKWRRRESNPPPFALNLGKKAQTCMPDAFQDACKKATDLSNLATASHRVASLPVGRKYSLAGAQMPHQLSILH